MALPTQAAFTISFLIGIVPAIVILFYTVKEYEKYFKDRHFFFALLISLFLSVLAGFFHLAIFSSMSYLLEVIGLMIVVVALAVFETLVKIVILNMPRFKRKYDTTFYGAAFGFGFASFIVIAVSYINLSMRQGPLLEIGVGLIIFSLAVVFMQGALGIYIGYGCYKLELFSYSLKAIIIQVPFNFILILWYMIIWYYGIGGLELIAVAVLYAFGFYLYVYRNILPNALPEDLRKHRRRTLRKVKTKVAG